MTQLEMTSTTIKVGVGVTGVDFDGSVVVGKGSGYVTLKVLSAPPVVIGIRKFGIQMGSSVAGRDDAGEVTSRSIDVADVVVGIDVRGIKFDGLFEIGKCHNWITLVCASDASVVVDIGFHARISQDCEGFVKVSYGRDPVTRNGMSKPPVVIGAGIIGIALNRSVATRNDANWITFDGTNGALCDRNAVSA